MHSLTTVNEVFDLGPTLKKMQQNQGQNRSKPLPRQEFGGNGSESKPKPIKNHKTSSKFHNKLLGITKHKNRLTPSYRGFFFKETSWAGRSAWHDRHVGIVEVPGSNPGPSTETSLSKKFHQEIEPVHCFGFKDSLLLSLGLVRIFGLC